MLSRAAATLALLLLLPVAAASSGDAPDVQAAAVASTQHILFLHPIDALADIPMNTQPPPEDYRADLPLSAGANSLSCVPGAPLGASNEYHTTYGYPTPTLIDYGASPPRVRPERGIGLDLALEGDLTLHWYVSPVLAGGAGSVPAPVLPNVVVRATLRAGDAISVGDAAYNAGDVVAQGETPPAFLAGPLTTGATYSEVDGDPVYAFAVPLTLRSPVLPGGAGFNLRVDTFLLEEGCPEGGYAMPSAIAIHTSEGHRPRLEFQGAAPFQAAFFRPAITDGRVTVQTAVTAAWGFYDVRDVELTIVGPSAAPTVFGFIFDPRVSGTPFGVTDPFSGQWTWDTAHDEAGPGHYEATFTITDRKGTVHTVAQAGFDLAPEQESPGVAPLGWVLALVTMAAMAVARRR